MTGPLSPLPAGGVPPLVVPAVVGRPLGPIWAPFFSKDPVQRWANQCPKASVRSTRKAGRPATPADGCRSPAAWAERGRASPAIRTTVVKARRNKRGDMSPLLSDGTRPGAIAIGARPYTRKGNRAKTSVDPDARDRDREGNRGGPGSSSAARAAGRCS